MRFLIVGSCFIFMDMKDESNDGFELLLLIDESS